MDIYPLSPFPPWGEGTDRGDAKLYIDLNNRVELRI
jgi:hypothetical protein